MNNSYIGLTIFRFVLEGKILFGKVIKQQGGGDYYHIRYDNGFISAYHITRIVKFTGQQYEPLTSFWAYCYIINEKEKLALSLKYDHFK
jgi:hypothetical protein